MSKAPQSKRRAAAAEVFRQQNLMPAEQEADFTSDVESLDEVQLGGALPKSPPPPPAPISQSYGGMYSEDSFTSDERESPRMRKAQRTPMANALEAFKTSEELQLEKDPVRVRETGFWFFKRVVVPPNAYVVHTRIGHDDPVTIGLGLSFRYNPYTDAYLVVPAAMQTIGVVSNCISQEKQGINVLAYVQWQIDNFSIAYRKLDFSDTNDPLGIVNAQLREQADAAIKDKIATMNVDEVLTDKAPIIEELTRRLTEVSEGRVRGSSDEDEGLGIKIVTVQIKEAFVSSQSLWENLQAPYRHERERIARISLMEMQEEIRVKQLATRQQSETSEAETAVQIERVKEEKSTEALQIRLDEEEKRKQREQTLRANELRRSQEDQLEHARLNAETNAQKRILEMEQEIAALEEQRQLAETRAQVEQQRLTHVTELERAEFAHKQAAQTLADDLKNTALQGQLSREQQEAESDITIEGQRQVAAHAHAQQLAEIARLQQEIQNLTNEQSLLKQWIEMLPQLAEHMPEIEEMRVLQTGDHDHLAAFLTQQGSLLNAIRDFVTNGRPADKPTEDS